MWALCLVQYFVPLMAISFAYIRIAVVLWGSKTPGAAQDQRDQIVLRNKKKVRNKNLEYSQLVLLYPIHDYIEAILTQ